MTRKLIVWMLVFLLLVSSVLSEWIVDDLRDESTGCSIDWDMSNAESNDYLLDDSYINSFSAVASGAAKTGNVSFTLFDNASFIFRTNNTAGEYMILGLGDNNYNNDFYYKVILHSNGNTYVELPSGRTFTYAGVNGLTDWLFQFNYYDWAADNANYTFNISYKNVAVTDAFGDMTGWTPLLANVSLNSSDVDNYSGVRAKVYWDANRLNKSTLINFSYNSTDDTGEYSSKQINISWLCAGFGISDLLVYYKFDDTNTSNNGTSIIEPAYAIPDGVKYQTNGTITGALTGQASKSGFEECYYFDGADDYILYSLNVANILNSSMNVWVKLEPKLDHVITYNTPAIAYVLSGFDTAYPFRSFRAYFDATAVNQIHTANSPPPAHNWTHNEWQMITMVYDEGTDNHSVYMNGSLVNYSTGGGQSAITNSSQNYLSYTGAGGMKGWMDEYSFWNRSLSQEEVTYLYNTDEGKNISLTDLYTLSINYGYSYNDVNEYDAVTIYFNFSDVSILNIINATIVYDTGEFYYTDNYTINGIPDVLLNFSLSDVGIKGIHNFDVFIDFITDTNETVPESITETLTVTPFFVDDCSGYESMVFFLNFFEENKTTQFINSTAELFLTYWKNKDVKTYNYSDIFYGQPDNWSVCVSPSNTTFYGDIYVRFYPINNVGFVNKYYSFNTTLSNNTQNISLYAYNSTTGISDLKITVRNSTSYAYYTVVLGKLFRYYVNTGVWLDVQHSLSDDFGLLFYNIEEEDTDYKLYFYDTNNNLLEVTNTLKFVCELDVCNLEYLISPIIISDDVDDLETNYILQNQTNGDYFILFNWSDPEGDTRTVYSQIQRYAGSRTVKICSFTQTGSSGNVSCNVTGYRGSIFLDVNVYGSNQSIVNEWFTIKLARLGEIVTETEGAFWVFFILTSIVLIGLWSPVGTLLMTGIGYVIIYFLGLFTPMTMSFVIVAMVVSLVIAVVVKK